MKIVRRTESSDAIRPFFILYIDKIFITFAKTKSSEKTMRQILIIAMLILTAALADGASPRWETVDTPGRIFTEQQQQRTDPEDSAADIAVRDSNIYVSASRQVNVKVFTILGQLISQATLPAGTHRLHINAKGIYILKIGATTRRVTI